MVRIKLTNRDLSLNVLAMCDSGSSISFVDNSVVSKIQLQGRKTSLSETIDNSAILYARKTEIG